jgi:hypothetical protein
LWINLPLAKDKENVVPRRADHAIGRSIEQHTTRSRVPDRAALHENVGWYVLKTPVQTQPIKSRAAKAYPMNAHWCKPLNDRDIREASIDNTYVAERAPSKRST